MPFYEIFHACPLTQAQRRRLAEEITTLHCTTFSAPSAFVNVALHRYSQSESDGYDAKTLFVGGKEARTNYIIGHLRPRGSDNRAKLLEITKALTRIWNSILRSTHPGRLDDVRALHNVFLMEDILAGAEQGFLLPVAGEDAKWATEHLADFRRRAEGGDASMQRMVGEVERGFGKVHRCKL